MKLTEYMPTFLQEVQEFKEIFASEDVELDDLKKRINELLNEVIVQTAKSYGLDRYEKIYGINNITTDIEKRRFNIISKINNKVPFTYKWLDNKLKQLVGENNYKISVEYGNYKVIISIVYLFDDIVDMLKKDLKQLLPANLVIQINLVSNCNLYISAIMHEKKRIKLGVIR